MDEEREVVGRLLPGLDEELSLHTLEELESPDGPAIEIFREAGGAGLVVPRESAGLGAHPAEAIQVQRAIGARSPSLAVATNMHHFSVASLLAASRHAVGFEWMLLEAIAAEKQLLASGFAEGIHCQGVFAPTMKARRGAGEIRVTGSKKPCSLSRSMNLLTASVLIESEESGEAGQFAVALIPADAPGIEIRPFWSAPVLAGAQSDEVILRDVPVDSELVVDLGDPSTGLLDAVQATGFVWFELLITASYLGMATALIERLVLEEKGTAGLRAAAVVELEAAMSSLEGVAARMERGDHPTALLTLALACRYAAQDAITRAVASAVEQLGGMAFIRSPEVTYLAAASRALAFHPPSRPRTVSALAAAFAGQALEVK